MQRSCPYCGAVLPEEASFCPFCAQSVNRKNSARFPRCWNRKKRLAGAVLLVLAGLALWGWSVSRPQVYDNGGPEVLYTDRDGTYQVLAGWMNDRFQPAEMVYQPVEERDIHYTFPQCLFVNHPDSGVNAQEEFLTKVARVTASFVQPEDSQYPWDCSDPAPWYEYIPEAALVTSINFFAWSGTAELVWTIEMKNGDSIRLHQTMTAIPQKAYRCSYEDTPMETIEELQALADEVSAAGEAYDFIEFYLPPVTYSRGLELNMRAINLYGSTGPDGTRTTFTDTVHITASKQALCYVDNIDFVGDGSGVGLSASNRVHLTNCRVAGWRIGVLAYGSKTWVNLGACVVEDNQIGFHFNATGINVSRSIYSDNLFQNNTTAILLEQVPTDVALSFDGSRFTGNEIDIDNRCHQALKLDGAVFDSALK